jgi:hypothetical protein
MTDRTNNYTTIQKKLRVKKFLLMLLYYPLQLVIQICISPFVICVIAAMRSENQANEDVYITEDNEWLNQDGPMMRRKKRHWWITRFIGLDCLFED